MLELRVERAGKYRKGDTIETSDEKWFREMHPEYCWEVGPDGTRKELKTCHHCG